MSPLSLSLSHAHLSSLPFAELQLYGLAQSRRGVCVYMFVCVYLCVCVCVWVCMWWSWGCTNQAHRSSDMQHIQRHYEAINTDGRSNGGDLTCNLSPFSAECKHTHIHTHLRMCKQKPPRTTVTNTLHAQCLCRQMDQIPSVTEKPFKTFGTCTVMARMANSAISAPPLAVPASIQQQYSHSILSATFIHYDCFSRFCMLSTFSWNWTIFCRCFTVKRMTPPVPPARL